MVLDVVRGGVQARAGGDDRADTARCAGSRTGMTVRGARGADRPRAPRSTTHHMPNVRPVPATTTKTASHGPALRADHRRQRGDRADHTLTERDDRQQAIAFGDVVGVPRRAALAGLGQPRAQSTRGAEQQRHDRERHRDRGVQEDRADPSDLRDGDDRGVGQARRRGAPGPASPRVTIGPPTRFASPRIRPPGRRCRRGRRARSTRTSAGSPSARMSTPTICSMVISAVDPVVGVVGRREPAEIDPGPADGERREREAGQPGADVVLGEHVRELRRRDAERDDERQVEEQLQRRRHPVLVRADRGPTMRRKRWAGTSAVGDCGLIHSRSVLLDGGDRTRVVGPPLHSRHGGCEEIGDRRERVPRFPRHPATRGTRRRRPRAASPDQFHARPSTTSTSNATTATSSMTTRCAPPWPAVTTSSTAPSTPARGCATRRRCSAPTSRACSMCWTRRSMPTCGVSSSPAPSPPSGSPRTAARHREDDSSTGPTRAAATSGRGWRRRIWCCSYARERAAARRRAVRLQHLRPR